MREPDIIHEAGSYWAWKDRKLYKIMRNVGTHAEGLGEAYADASLAIARVNYLAKREIQNSRNRAI